MSRSCQQSTRFFDRFGLLRVTLNNFITSRHFPKWRAKTRSSFHTAFPTSVTLFFLTVSGSPRDHSIRIRLQPIFQDGDHEPEVVSLRIPQVESGDVRFFDA
jgi:hypothetical protein